MRIKIDKVAIECADRMIYTTFFGVGLIKLMDRKLSDRDVESLAFLRLGILVWSGAAVHEYSASDNLDQFKSTDRLIKYWNYIYPGKALRATRNEWITLTFRDSRARLFKPGWSDPFPGLRPPAWPN